MSLLIRPGTQEDINALTDVDSVIPNDPQRAVFIETWLGNDIVLIAELAGRVIGYSVFNHRFFHQGQVDMLMIHPDFRGRHIGEYLLKAIEEICDTPKLYVTTNLSNHRMQRLLLRMRYQPCGYIDELDPGDPELIFVKKVKNQ